MVEAMLLLSSFLCCCEITANSKLSGKHNSPPAEAAASLSRAACQTTGKQRILVGRARGPRLPLALRYAVAQSWSDRARSRATFHAQRSEPAAAGGAQPQAAALLGRSGTHRYSWVRASPRAVGPARPRLRRSTVRYIGPARAGPNHPPGEAAARRSYPVKFCMLALALSTSRIKRFPDPGVYQTADDVHRRDSSSPNSHA